MNFVTFSLMADLQIRVFRGWGMGCFQLVSSIKVSLLIKAFCLWGRFLIFVYRVSPKKATIDLFDFGPFLVFWTHSKVVQKGLKGNKMVNPCVVGHLGPFWPIWTPLGHFKKKIDSKYLRQTLLWPFGATERVQYTKKGLKSKKLMLLFFATSSN